MKTQEPTPLERAYYDLLCIRGRRTWMETGIDETRALQRLVKLGLARWNAEMRCWVPVEVERGTA